MRHIKVFLSLIAACLPLMAFNPDKQVLVNGRVATFGSVVAYCDGDTLQATQISVELPVKAPYLTKTRVAMERLYNSIHPDLISLSLAIICLIVALIRRRTILKAVFMFFTLSLVVDFALRWYLGEGIPLITVSDTCSAVAICLCATVCISLRSVSDKMLALAIFAALLLIIPSVIWGEHPSVRHVNNSLKSLWLIVHVPLVIASYSIFLISAVMAVIGKVGNRLRTLLIIGEVLLVSGIICGSLWAAEAWGRYWAWDPKETAALLTAIVYLAVILAWDVCGKRLLYRRIMVAASFLLVVITWFFITSGLHSY